MIHNLWTSVPNFKLTSNLRASPLQVQLHSSLCHSPLVDWFCGVFLPFESSFDQPFPFFSEKIWFFSLKKFDFSWFFHECTVNGPSVDSGQTWKSGTVINFSFFLSFLLSFSVKDLVFLIFLWISVIFSCFFFSSTSDSYSGQSQSLKSVLRISSEMRCPRNHRAIPRKYSRITLFSMFFPFNLRNLSKNDRKMIEIWHNRIEICFLFSIISQNDRLYKLF